MNGTTENEECLSTAPLLSSSALVWSQSDDGQGLWNGIWEQEPIDLLQPEAEKETRLLREIQDPGQLPETG